MIFVSGTLAGRFRRQRPGKTTWDDARVCAAAFEATGSWDGESIVAAPPPDAAPAPPITIPDAITVYLSKRGSANLAPASLRKYGGFTRELQAFANSRGYVMPDQFTVTDIDVFYSTSKLDIRSKAKMLETLRAFWRFCVNRELVAKSAVSADLKPPMGAIAWRTRCRYILPAPRREVVTARITRC